MSWSGTGGADVIPFGKVKADMRFPMIEEVRGYWEALRSGRPVPLRSEVDPRGIERALENTFVLERIAPGVARFRIAGMHLNDLMGMEVRGMPLTAFFTPKGREMMSRLLETVFDGPEIVDLTLQGERGIGKPALDARMVILPLKSDAGEVNRALGCLCTQGPVGRSPRRFDISDTRVTRIQPRPTAPSEQLPVRAGLDNAPRKPVFDLLPSDTIRTDRLDTGAQQKSPAGSGLSESGAAFDATDAPVRGRPDARRPYLRLVKSDD